MANETQIRVLSFNCWGLKYLSKHRQFRLRSLAEKLRKDEYDLIAFQELWVQADYDHMKESLGLPFSKYFYSGVFGSGLAIFSRFPILSSTFRPYSLYGKPLKLFHGDFYVGKGVGAIVLQHPCLGEVSVLNTHLHAGYGGGYQAYRASECWELAQWVQRCPGSVIVMGDFNSTPDTLNYRLIQNHGRLQDVWSFSSDPGITCNSPFNTFSYHYQKQDPTLGKRLDYIFYRQLQCIQSSLAMTEPIPGQTMNYSDHFGVSALFTAQSHPPHEQPRETWTVQALKTLMIQALAKARKDARHLLIACFLLLSLLILLILVSIFLPILFRFHPHREVVIALLSFLIHLFSLLCSVLATVCFLVGLVFGHAEQRAILALIDTIDGEDEQ
ncbi:Endonuclease/exonuclease/phosphatase [Sporodiniella umbellata]|nr:Endonuclease/exonuclease/phosphatase [Sporodiniella umbellata]